jgi:5-methylcytosine-specific restriction enzyme subunit McrC
LSIPIQNIYYLLCYAWDKLEEGKKVEVSASEYSDSINLFSRVLVNACRRLFKQGLDRYYNEILNEYNGIKGKIKFKESITKNLFKHGKSICEFDEFEANILQNQLLKATLLRLTKIESVEKDLKIEIWDCYWKLSNVSDISIRVPLFSNVRIHRNNSFYDFILRICKLIIENTVLDKQKGTYYFLEFMGSEKEMANLFEAFIRNFYKKEQDLFKVYREDINWAAHPIDNSSIALLPKMQTDISLESKDRKIIIETKYYVNALSTRFESEKFISANLYQLYSYLRNIEYKEDNLLNPSCEGILLYPTVNYTLNENFLFGSHVLKIKTIDLNNNWNIIERNLLNIIM